MMYVAFILLSLANSNQREAIRKLQVTIENLNRLGGSKDFVNVLESKLNEVKANDDMTFDQFDRVVDDCKKAFHAAGKRIWDTRKTFFASRGKMERSFSGLGVMDRGVLATGLVVEVRLNLIVQNSVVLLKRQGLHQFLADRNGGERVKMNGVWEFKPTPWAKNSLEQIQQRDYPGGAAVFTDDDYTALVDAAIKEHLRTVNSFWKNAF